jgi:hypothetical protein
MQQLRHRSGRLDQLRRGCLVVALVGGTAVSSDIEAATPPSIDGVGQVDFLQYWAAHKVMLAEQDPYAAGPMLALERRQGFRGPEPQIGWNPPWLVTLLSPVLIFSLRTSTWLWLGLNVLFATLLGLAVVRTYRGRGAMRPALLPAFFLFHPLVSNLHYGQVGLLLAFCVAGFLYAAHRERDLLAGVLLVPLSAKPHLVYLLLPLLVYWMVLRRRWRVAAGFVLGFGALLAWTWLRYPGSFSAWTSGLRARPPIAWMTATLAGVLRLQLHRVAGVASQWPIVAVPSFTLAAFTAWLLVRRPLPDLRRLLPPVLALSLFTAPYGWLFDQCLLLPIQVGLVALACADGVPARSRRAVVGAVISVQVAMFGGQILGLCEMQDYFVFPLALFLVWAYSVLRLRLSEQPDVASAPAGGKRT